MKRLFSLPKLFALALAVVGISLIAHPAYAGLLGPEIISPTSGTILNSNQSSLEWSEIPQTQQYLVEVYSDANLTTPIYFFVTSDNQVALNQIGGEGDYWWHVLAITSESETDWSSVGQFTVDNTTPNISLSNSQGASEGLIDFTASYQDSHLEKYWVEVTDSVGTLLTSTEPVFTSIPSEGEVVYTLDTRDLEEGEYSVTMYVVDAVGNMSTATISIMVENMTPTEDYQCKKDGWQTYGTMEFKNQGQCIKYINHL